MPHVGAKEILSRARQEGYGVPCLLVGNMEMLVGSVRAAETCHAPIILAYNAQVTPQMPMHLLVPAMVRAARDAIVPIATILDHGADEAIIRQAIDCGISTVMYDGSLLPFAENLRTTREIVRMAHDHGVDVEGEVGTIGGSSIELGYEDAHSIFTDPLQAVEFVQYTGVDLLAISFGNLHGIYDASPTLDLARVRTIDAGTSVPLAMHGASGLAPAVYASVIEAGISKINYYTAMARAVTHDLYAHLAAAKEEDLVYHHVISRVTDRFAFETCHLLDTLGCRGQAG